jgi:NAD(P)-dependent dehydrogenase (short-subunit alcohol dehydrogenase family)
LVTGANRGIGFEFAKQYAADGWSVIATCRRPQEADALAGLQGDIDVHGLDVTDFARVEALSKRLSGVAIDVLINNAGAYGPREVAHDTIDYRAWCEVLRVNTMAPVKLASLFTDHVAASDRKTIVSITSLMGSITDNTSGGSYIYRSSKAALNAAMRSLACDLKGRGITVAVLHPGWVRTDMGGARATMDPFESVAALRQVIADLELKDTGRFINFDGHEIPW